jgi:hypothetical protein
MQRFVASVFLIVLIAIAIIAHAATTPTPNPASHGLAADAGMNAIAITPSDANVFQYPVRVWVGGAGTLAVQAANNPGTTVTFTVAANTYLPLYVVAVMATGTTATLLVGVY